VQRSIVGFNLDEEGDWVAQLDCCHGQHVRHQPPFVNRPWVVTQEGRTSMLGSTLSCVRCDRLELPADLVLYQRTPVCTAASMPTELRQGYTTRSGVWSCICLLSGEASCTLGAPVSRTLTLEPLSEVAIPPQVLHSLHASPTAHFYIEFFASLNLVRELVGEDGAIGEANPSAGR